MPDIKEGSVEHLKMLMDNMKKSLKSVNAKHDFLIDHIKQLNDNIYILEQRLIAAGIRLRK